MFFQVYSIVSFSNKPVTAFTFSIIRKPVVGKCVPVCTVIVVSVAVAAVSKVVDNSNAGPAAPVTIGTPPTGDFTA